MTFKIPLRMFLIVPFVLQVAGIVGITGWLSFRNGQQAVNNLASQLREETTQRVEHEIEDILTTATTISALTAKTIAADRLELSPIRTIENLYWTHLTTFETINGLGVGNRDGEVMGMFRRMEADRIAYYLEYTELEAGKLHQTGT